jgi:hypothetical protein
LLHKGYNLLFQNFYPLLKIRNLREVLSAAINGFGFGINLMSLGTGRIHRQQATVSFRHFDIRENQVVKEERATLV